jgi:hypothetical protein
MVLNMVNRNLAKEVTSAKFTPQEVKQLILGARYIYGRTNQSKVKIPFNPKYGNYKDDYLPLIDIKSMNTRLANFIKVNKKNPAYVGVIAPNNATGGTVAVDTGGKIQKAFEKKLGKIDNLTQAINKTRSLGYDYYLNTWRNVGQGSLFKNIDRLGNTPMNCVDYTNVLSNLALEKGYQVRILQIKCKTASHILFEVKGYEFKDWTRVDIAAMADKNSAVCNTGKVCWCTNPFGKGVEVMTTNPKWYFNMFLDDLLV